jgi:sugar-specific transcriptional regulator TrmB
MFVLNGNAEEITKLFRPFGLTEYEARVYFTLQVCGKTKICRLWIKSGIPQSKIYQLMPELVEKDLSR